MPMSWDTRWLMASPLDSLLADIDALEADDDGEPDLFPWTDAARWSPAAALEAETADPYDDTLPAFADDGAVIIVDPLRPWVVLEYQPPWWARD